MLRNKQEVNEMINKNEVTWSPYMEDLYTGGGGGNRNFCVLHAHLAQCYIKRSSLFARKI